MDNSDGLPSGNYSNNVDATPEEKTITLSESEWNAQLAAARRGGESRVSARTEKPPTAIDQLTAAVAQMAAMQAAAMGASMPGAQAATAAAPTATARPVMASSAGAPVKVDMLTNAGVTDVMRLSPQQLDALGPGGVRAEYEKLISVSQQLSGAPPRPKINRR